MELDSALITLSLMGLAFAPLWALLWTRTLGRTRMPRARRALSVVALSLVTFMVVCMGPLAVLGSNHGLFDRATTDFNVVATLILFCFIGVIIQVIAALGFSLAAAREPT